MAPLFGVFAGTGLFLIWWSFWEKPAAGKRRPKANRLEDLLASAGIEKVTATGLVASCLGLGVFVALIFFVVSGSWPMSLCFGLFGAWLPISIVRWRSNRRTAVLRQLWPDVVDHLRSAIRAGLSLPEALIQLGEKGPEELRHVFRDFGADYRAGGQFDASLNKLKDRLADPVADRIVEALRLTREVGGSDLGKLLGTLAEFLRENARTRSELEARQSWTVNAARLAVAAPWIVMLLLATLARGRERIQHAYGSRRPGGRSRCVPNLLLHHAAHRCPSQGRESAAMNGMSAAAIVCGVVLGIGLWLTFVRLPFMRPLTFIERIEPQLKSQNLESRLLRASGHNATPFGPLERIVRPLLHDGLTALGRLNLGSKALTRRLAQAGINKSPLDFRAEQLLWSAAGFTFSLALVMLSAAAGRFSPFLAVVAVLGSALGGFLFRDFWLGVQISKRESHMMAEFPSLAELMALAVGAGESATGALDRVCRSANGELAKEFSKILAETRAGKPLVEALQEFSARTDLGPLVRFVDGIIVAVERAQWSRLVRGRGPRCGTIWT